MLFRLFAIAIAMFFGAWLSAKFSLKTIGRKLECRMAGNEKSAPLLEPELHWTAVHIRVDVGGIHNFLVIANTLLAGCWLRCECSSFKATLARHPSHQSGDRTGRQRDSSLNLLRASLPTARI
jgi:hypothetical protein